MRNSIPPVLVALSLGLALAGQAARGQEMATPVLAIWDIALGKPITDVPEIAVGEIACGTAGGPPGQALAAFDDFLSCQPEASGLREVAFSYDDEQDYIARALDAEYRFLQGGTSVFAHPVIVSLLVDPSGIIQGRRIVTDDRIGDYERRTAVALSRNFKARFGAWSLSCEDLPMKEGEQKVGNQFIHEFCTGLSPDGASAIAIEATFLRKKGQLAIAQETQTVNTGYFESRTRFEEVLLPYAPAGVP